MAAERRRKKSASSAPTSKPGPAAPESVAEPRAARRPPTTTTSQGGLSIYNILLIALLPLVNLLFKPEAPLKPFALQVPGSIPATAGANAADSVPVVVRPRILFVTAHPDDEVLFAPTLLALSDEKRRNNVDVFALVLSTGDAGGGEDPKTLATKRKGELEASWDLLGVQLARRFVLDNPRLRDNRSDRWDPADIASAVEPYVLEYDINTILTFDNWGVTNNANHYSLPYGIQHLLRTRSQSQSTTQTPIQLYTLKSVHWNQHLGPLSSIFTQLSLGFHTVSTIVLHELGVINATATSPDRVRAVTFVSAYQGWRTAVDAARKHESQWEGRFYAWPAVVLARYLWVNEWDLVVKDLPVRSYLF